MPLLTLRERLPTDDPTIWRWLYGEENPEWRLWDGPYFLNKPQPMPWQEYQQRLASNPPQANPDRRIIALNDKCIGMVTRSEEDPAGGDWWELGIVIYDPQHWGGGLGGQALQLWTEATFSQTDAHVITLTTWSGNQRMIAAALRVGFRECARIPEARLWQGQRWDSVKLAVLRREWNN